MLDLDPILLLPLALVLGLMALPVVTRKVHGPVDFIQPRDLGSLVGGANAPLIVDLRSVRDFTREHIQGAVNVSERELAGFIGRRADGTRVEAVLVCDSDTRSIRAAGRLRKAGYGGILVMQGGMFRWKRAHLPVVAGA